MLVVGTWGWRAILSGALIMVVSGMMTPALGGDNSANGPKAHPKNGGKIKGDDVQGPRPLHGQNRNQTDEIVVTAVQPQNSIASRGKVRTAQNTPASVTVVDSEEIREIMPRTAAESLRRKPGIWVQKTGHSGGAPVVRGFIGNQIGRAHV